MIDTYKQLIANQYQAALSMLSAAVDQCPDECWEKPIVNLKFCQVAFHALFFSDIYLGPNLESLRNQVFHFDHVSDFGDYEELEDRPQQMLYKKAFVQAYLGHCRAKVAEILASETDEILNGPSGFEWLKFKRAEVHVYNIRHIHHHAAQLSLWLRSEIGDGVAWAGSGWRSS